VKRACPHCGKLVPAHMLARYHGDNCKQKAVEE